MTPETTEPGIDSNSAPPSYTTGSDDIRADGDEGWILPIGDGLVGVRYCRWRGSAARAAGAGVMRAECRRAEAGGGGWRTDVLRASCVRRAGWSLAEQAAGARPPRAFQGAEAAEAEHGGGGRSQQAAARRDRGRRRRGQTSRAAPAAGGGSSGQVAAGERRASGGRSAVAQWRSGTSHAGVASSGGPRGGGIGRAACGAATRVVAAQSRGTQTCQRSMRIASYRGPQREQRAPPWGVQGAPAHRGCRPGRAFRQGSAGGTGP